MRILCYARPWNASQMQHIALAAAPNATLLLCSEHRDTDQTGLVAEYYRALKSGLSESEYADSERSDMIARCRLLRHLAPQEASRHFIAMESAVHSSLMRAQPDAVLALTVDSYVLDLIRAWCNRNGKRFIGLVPTFVNGYFRVTARGEPTQNPVAPSMEQVAGITESLLHKSYTPLFNDMSKLVRRKTLLRRWIAHHARVPYFFLRRHLSGDCYNYHYWASQVVSANMRTLCPAKDPGRMDWKEAVIMGNKPVLYVPLQMFPEATVDYWCSNPHAIRYYEALESYISLFADKYQIILKEHPAILGSRPSGFYQKIRADNRVIVAPTFVRSNDVLDVAQAVLVWTGSVGFEAALRGLPVLTVGRPYYSYGRHFMHIDDGVTLSDVNTHINAVAGTQITNSEQWMMVEYLLRQFYRGHFANDGTWSGSATDLRQSEQMGESLRTLVGLPLQSGELSLLQERVK